MRDSESKRQDLVSEATRRMSTASWRAGCHLLQRIVAVRSCQVWALPRQLRTFVLAVIAADVVALVVAASFTHVTLGNLGLFGLLLCCTIASAEMASKSGEQAGGTKEGYGVWGSPAASCFP